MARLTVEHCISKFKNNRYDTIHVAAMRAHQLEAGAKPKVNPENDKPVVIALREIEAGYTDFTNEEIPEKNIYGQIIEDTSDQTENVSTGTEERK